MRAANYFSDLQPPEVTILGIRLLPLTAGHLIRMHCAGVGFVTGATPTIEDLLLSVIICSSSYEQSGKILSDPNLTKLIHRWTFKAAGGGLFRKPQPIEWTDKIAAFEHYFADGTQMPNVRFDSQPDCVPNNCPMVLRVLVEVEQHSNWTRAQLLDRSYKETLWDWLVLCLREKRINQFVSEEEAADHDDALEVAKQAAQKVGLL